MPRLPVPDLGSHSRENKAAFNGAFHNSPPLSLAFRCTYWILPNILSQAESRWKCWFRPLIGQELRHSPDSQLPFLKPATFLWWTTHKQRCTNQDCGPTTRPLCCWLTREWEGARQWDPKWEGLPQGLWAEDCSRVPADINTVLRIWKSVCNLAITVSSLRLSVNFHSAPLLCEMKSHYIFLRTYVIISLLLSWTFASCMK